MNKWIVWNLLFPLHEAAKGHKTLRILREMEKADRMSVEALEQLRREKLRDLMEYCYANVPYIRQVMQERGLTPQQIQSPEQLAQLPVMSKATIRAHRSQLRSTTAERLASFTTGG